MKKKNSKLMLSFTSNTKDILEELKKINIDIKEISRLNNIISNLKTEIENLKGEVCRFKTLVNTYKNESANKNKLIDLLFSNNFEDDSIEIAVVKSFVGKPEIVYRGKRIDVSDANSISIYINNGEIVELDINRQ